MIGNSQSLSNFGLPYDPRGLARVPELSPTGPGVAHSGRTCIGPKRPQKHKHPTNHDFWKPPFLLRTRTSAHRRHLPKTRLTIPTTETLNIPNIIGSLELLGSGCCDQVGCIPRCRDLETPTIIICYSWQLGPLAARVPSIPIHRHSALSLLDPPLCESLLPFKNAPLWHPPERTKLGELTRQVRQPRIQMSP